MSLVREVLWIFGYVQVWKYFMDGPKEGGKDMPIDSVIQSGSHKYVSCLPLPLCESRNFYSVRARPEKCGISRDLRLCSILHHGKQDGGKRKVIKWNPHSLFSSPYYLYKVSCLASRSIAIFGGRRFSKSRLSCVPLTDRQTGLNFSY